MSQVTDTTETTNKWNIAMDYMIAATILSGLDEIKDKFTEWSNEAPETELWKERLEQIEVAREALFSMI